MNDINQSNWHQEARKALQEDRPAYAEQIAREHGVGWHVGTPSGRGILVDVHPFKANIGTWHLSVYVMRDGTESYPGLFTAPNGKKCTFIGELSSLKLPIA